MIGRMVLALSAVATIALAADAPPEMAKGPLAASAGWQFVTSSQEMAVYMKRAEKAPASKAVRHVWTAYDSEAAREVHGFSFHSVASLGEYDCAKRVSRVLRETYHAGQGLVGAPWVAPDFIPTDWAEAVEGTVGEQRMEFACPSTRA